MVALSTTFLAALIICLIISFIVTYLAHRPRLALVMPSPFVSCLLNCNSFNSLVTPATCHRFTCFNKLHSRELHAARSFLALGKLPLGIACYLYWLCKLFYVYRFSQFSLSFVDSIVIFSVRNLTLARQSPFSFLVYVYLIVFSYSPGTTPFILSPLGVSFNSATDLQPVVVRSPPPPDSHTHFLKKGQQKFSSLIRFQ